jgi:hypothetical protein
MVTKIQEDIKDTTYKLQNKADLEQLRTIAVDRKTWIDEVVQNVVTREKEKDSQIAEDDKDKQKRKRKIT